MTKATSPLLLFLLVFSLTLALAFTADAVVEVVEFESPQQQKRYQSLIAELRCVVCQNQNLADSDAPLAQDLREIAADMIKADKSDQEIKDFMVQRYGEFVLYRPPFSLANAALWLAPLALLILTAYFLLRHIRGQSSASEKLSSSLSEADEKKLKKLLYDSHDDNNLASAKLPNDDGSSSNSRGNTP